MSSEVLDFLARVATEPRLFAEFQQDADATMSREGLEEKAKKALASGDPLRVHAAIRGNATANEEAYEKSMRNAQTIMDVLAQDPTVAQWLYHHYQQVMMWGALAPSQAPGPGAAPAPVPTPANLNNG